MAITLSKLCKNTEKMYGLTLIAGKGGMENIVRWVHMVEDTEVPDFLHGNELVFTTGIAHQQINWLLYFVKNLKDNNAAGVVINLGPYIASVPPQVIVYCEQNHFPLFTLPWETHIIDITYSFCRMIIKEEKEEQSLAEAFKNAILDPERKEGYETTLEKMGFAEESPYTVILIKFKHEGKNITSKFLSQEEAKLRKMLRINTLAKGIFFWNGRLVLIYQNVTEEIVEAFCKRIQNFCQGVNPKIGVSESQKGYQTLSALYQQAQAAMKIAEVKQCTLKYYREIEEYKLLLNVKNSTYLKAYYLEHLGSLIQYDQNNPGDLYQILRKYCELNGSVNELAEVLGVHRNTVNYKIKKIKEILKSELNYKEIMHLMLAFSIEDILIKET